MLLMCGHFLPRGEYTPGCHKGLGQDVSSADEIGIALVIAGDTSKRLPRDAIETLIASRCGVAFAFGVEIPRLCRSASAKRGL